MEVGQHAGTKSGVFIYKTSSNEWKYLSHSVTGILLLCCRGFLYVCLYMQVTRSLLYNVCRAGLAEQLVELVTDTISVHFSIKVISYRWPSTLTPKNFVPEMSLLMKLNRICFDKSRWSFIRINLGNTSHAQEFHREQLCMLLLVWSVHVTGKSV
jgi:hypothetical protein